MPGLAVQNYATYPSMPGALRALCPVRRGVITGIRPYARYHWIQPSAEFTYKFTYKFRAACSPHRKLEKRIKALDPGTGT